MGLKGPQKPKTYRDDKLFASGESKWLPQANGAKKCENGRPKTVRNRQPKKCENERKRAKEKGRKRAKTGERVRKTIGVLFIDRF